MSTASNPITWLRRMGCWAMGHDLPTKEFVRVSSPYGTHTERLVNGRIECSTTIYGGLETLPRTCRRCGKNVDG